MEAEQEAEQEEEATAEEAAAEEEEVHVASPLASAPKPAAVGEGLSVKLRQAALKGDVQAVAAWLDEGGGVDARCAERADATLLMVAAFAGQEAMVRMLLQRGASVNLQNSYGGTALMNAAINGHTTTVQALLDAKADTSLQDSDGDTALIWAEGRKNTATAQLLRQHGERQTAEAEVRAAASALEGGSSAGGGSAAGGGSSSAGSSSSAGAAAPPHPDQPAAAEGDLARGLDLVDLDLRLDRNLDLAAQLEAAQAMIRAMEAREIEMTSREEARPTLSPYPKPAP